MFREMKFFFVRRGIGPVQRSVLERGVEKHGAENDCTMFLFEQKGR